MTRPAHRPAPPPADAPRASVWEAVVTREAAGGVEVFVVGGRLGSRGAQRLAAALAGLEPRPGGAWVVDLSAVDYVSSPALRLLDEAAARCGAAGSRLVLCAVDEAVRIGLELSGVGERVEVAATRDAALARARSAS